MQLNKIKPFVLSLFIHMAMIILIIAIDSPHPKQVNKRAGIQSYLYTKPAALEPTVKEPELIKPEHANSPPQVEKPYAIEQTMTVQNQALLKTKVKEHDLVKPEHANSHPQVEEPYAIEQTMTVQNQPVEEPYVIEQTMTVQNQPLPETRAIERVDEQPRQNAQMEQRSQQNNAKADLNEISTILSNTTHFITELNSKKLNELSQRSAHAYRQPEQLIDKSKKQSKDARLEVQSADFAPPGSGIIVLSEFGPNETTIMVEDSCMTVTKTDLLDPINRGVSVWRLGGAGCQKYDKFNGQLQKSLDKYLKN
ncbi:hypothetical protein BFC17_04165 [Alteromonas lipolytica]|uniref:Uncharacterized protein n=2 Tax=Alteromonas lipolytica TaxID=1856405 RepID=A0A1E8FC15_9ALTE|nr:hypothetical protein BFC17_04165 [Alteromonas lipolytica]